MSAVVWSQPNCAYCEMAKELLKSKGIIFEERKLGETWTKEQLFEAVPNARSVPQIFLNGEHIGGFNELKQKLKE